MSHLQLIAIILKIINSCSLEASGVLSLRLEFQTDIK